MKEFRFVRCVYNDTSSFAYIMLYTILLPITIMMGTEQYNWRRIAASALSLVLYFIIRVLMMSSDARGIYIENDEIYYDYERKKLNPDDVKGIKIAKYRTGSLFIRYYPKDKEGNYLYSMILLNEVSNGMKEFDGCDDKFLKKYGKNYICGAICDKGFINFIKQKNPDIIIM